MNNFSAADVMKFVKENDVKFIRLAFCDIFGRIKNISIMPSELPKAFDTGIPFDASAIKGFMNIEESDLFLKPDPSTMSILPWRPTQGGVIRFFCNINTPDGMPYEGDGRDILIKAINLASEKGFTIKIGTECEFYLFELDDKGRPTQIPHDNCGYCDVAPFDKGENVRREICLTLEEMGIMPEMSHHEQGAGQNEIDFKYGEALSAADNLITFKSVVKNVAHRNGLYASFMPKPLIDSSGSGLHINMSIYKDGKNIFDLTSHDTLTANFIAGILDKVHCITAFTNPITNSYERFGKYSAPSYITWSHQNRSQLIRIPAAQGDFKRVEIRNPDPACSPYLAFALLIHAGIDGIKSKLQLPEPQNINIYEANEETKKKLKRLPLDLGEALDLAKNSEFINSVLPKDTLNKFVAIKQEEWNKYTKAENKHKFEIEEYFYTV